MTGADFMVSILLQKMKPHKRLKVTLFTRHYTRRASEWVVVAGSSPWLGVSRS
jgi:hypothetical protein